MTRKRPAPGAAPVVPPMGPVPNYSTNPGNQLSNDQFLQWGQNPTNMVNASYPDTTYNPGAIQPTQDITASIPPGQVARRQPSQMVRNRPYDQQVAPYPENTAVANNSQPGASEESLEELYKRAYAAKKDSQAKRKQIPPFVQKLSR